MQEKQHLESLQKTPFGACSSGNLKVTFGKLNFLLNCVCQIFDLLEIVLNIVFLTIHIKYFFYPFTKIDNNEQENTFI